MKKNCIFRRKACDISDLDLDLDLDL